MKKMAIAATALVAALTASSANAAPLLLAYSGNSFSAILNLDVTGGFATTIGGNRNGVAITGLTNFGGSDQAVSNTAPFVTSGGISYTITGGEIFHLYRVGSSYFETNSVDDPTGVGANPAAILLIAADTANGGVPEPATWALMLTGFGMVGFGLRRARRQAVRVTYA